MFDFGGADSDVVLDICTKCDKEKKIEYIWFDTGLEYQATKDHLKYLETRYGIEIKAFKAIKPIPVCCKKYGQPFISKNVSEFIYRLQRHNFQWEDEEYEVLIKRYPKCQSALEWWCNKKKSIRLSIGANKWLKEYMIQNPPDFKISNKCCQYAKKDVAHKAIEANGYDLDILGVRKAESGVRSVAYKSCFDCNDNGCDEYRPVFWYEDADKKDYQSSFEIINSLCYSEYGLKRTGCAGCPYNKRFEEELQAIEEHEPKLYKAVNHIFAESYDYTRKYRIFANEMNEKEKSRKVN